VSEATKRNKIIVGTIILAAILILLACLSLILKAFVINVILHTYFRLLLIFPVIKVIQKCFGKLLNESMNKALILCACFITLDLVVVDAVRFVLSNGISTVLFLPACLPICFMILTLYSIKDTKQTKKANIVLTYVIGIPLLLLSLYVETLSFLQI